MWVGLALLAPLLWSFSIFLDKYLLDRIAHELSIGSMIILAGISGAPLIMIFGLVAHEQIAEYSWQSALGALISGGLLIFSYYFYYKAIAIADASLVAALLQLAVVFDYVLALLFLHEKLRIVQILAALVIITGSLIITLDTKGNAWNFRPRVLLLMVMAS